MLFSWANVANFLRKVLNFLPSYNYLIHFLTQTWLWMFYWELCRWVASTILFHYLLLCRGANCPGKNDIYIYIHIYKRKSRHFLEEAVTKKNPSISLLSQSRSQQLSSLLGWSEKAFLRLCFCFFFLKKILPISSLHSSCSTIFLNKP